jgi:hypothetical protein
MGVPTTTLGQIEELRRKLHLGLGATYDPVALQTLVPISQELDRLVVQFVRQQMADDNS